METTSLPWTFLGLIFPMEPYFQLKRSVAQSKSKSKADMCKRESGKNPSLGERDAQALKGLLTGDEEELGWVLTLKHGILTSSLRITCISA